MMVDALQVSMDLINQAAGGMGAIAEDLDGVQSALGSSKGLPSKKAVDD
jgi:hypothetical protein